MSSIENALGEARGGIRRKPSGSVFVLALLVCVALASGLASCQRHTSKAGGGETEQRWSNSRVLRVTTLEAEGEGSLREALEAEGPRIVVFEVGGVIDLRRQRIVVKNPYLRVAGQTAPSPGITLIRGELRVVTHHVRVEHLRLRPGDANQPTRSGWEPDGIAVSGPEAHDVLIDHCSVSWAVDENLSASGPAREGPDATSHDVTFRHCIIAEALDYATHVKGRHSKGLLVHDFAQRIHIVGNLFLHNARRNPYFKANATGSVVNNVIYNPDSAAVQVGFIAEEWGDTRYKPGNPRISVVGNVLIHGRNTYTDLPLLAYQGSAYLEDNLAFADTGKKMSVHHGVIEILKDKPAWPPGYKPVPAKDLIPHLLARAGARPKDRDAVDTRLVADFKARKGQLINSQREVGGYPSVRPTRRKLDVPTQDVEGWLARLSAELGANGEDL